MGKALAWVGGIGAMIGILCCFTPVLPIVLGALGATALIDVLYRDIVLLPFAGFSFILFGAGLWLTRRSN